MSNERGGWQERREVGQKGGVFWGLDTGGRPSVPWVVVLVATVRAGVPSDLQNPNPRF